MNDDGFKWWALLGTIDDPPDFGHTGNCVLLEQNPCEMWSGTVRIMLLAVMSMQTLSQNSTSDFYERVDRMRRLINKPQSAMKTKKYKCIEVDDDSDGTSGTEVISTSSENEGYVRASQRRTNLRRVLYSQEGTNQPPVESKDNPELINHPYAPIATIDAPPIALVGHSPRARAISSRRTHLKMVPLQTRSPMGSTNKPPLVLSPQHCKEIKYFAGIYGVEDVLSWVARNCAFAKMYLPNATCEEINILVASCRKHESEI